MGAGLSYGEVAAQVDVKCDDLDESRLLAIMEQCLREMWGNVCECPEYQVSGYITVQPGKCDYPLVLDDGTALNQVQQMLDETSCRDLECLTDLSERCSSTTGSPEQFEVWADTITLFPTPDSGTRLFVHGYRELDCDILTMDEEMVRNWQNIDLPVELHTAYMNCVLGFSFAEQGDYQAADYWIRIANGTIANFVEKKKRGPIRRSGVLRSEPFCHKPNPCCDDGDCCKVHGPTTITKPDKTEKDCHGRPARANYHDSLA